MYVCIYLSDRLHYVFVHWTLRPLFICCYSNSLVLLLLPTNIHTYIHSRKPFVFSLESSPPSPFHFLFTLHNKQTKKQKTQFLNFALIHLTTWSDALRMVTAIWGAWHQQPKFKKKTHTHTGEFTTQHHTSLTHNTHVYTNAERRRKKRWVLSPKKAFFLFSHPSVLYLHNPLFCLERVVGEIFFFFFVVDVVCCCAEIWFVWFFFFQVFFVWLTGCVCACRSHGSTTLSHSRFVCL